MDSLSGHLGSPNIEETKNSNYDDDDDKLNCSRLSVSIHDDDDDNKDTLKSQISPISHISQIYHERDRSLTIEYASPSKYIKRDAQKSHHTHNSRSYPSNSSSIHGSDTSNDKQSPLKRNDNHKRTRSLGSDEILKTISNENTSTCLTTNQQLIRSQYYRSPCSVITNYHSDAPQPPTPSPITIKSYLFFSFYISDLYCNQKN